MIQRDEKPLAASPVVNTPGFVDAVLVGDCRASAVVTDKDSCGTRRNRIWLVPEVLDAVDMFRERAPGNRAIEARRVDWDGRDERET